ncbi:hypothetical protein PV328_011868, partial [Microctonus aethiopoides]
YSAYELWKQCQLTDEKLRAIHKKPERNRSTFNSRLVTEQSCQAKNYSSLFFLNEIIESRERILAKKIIPINELSLSNILPMKNKNIGSKRGYGDIDGKFIKS